MIIWLYIHHNEILYMDVILSNVKFSMHLTYIYVCIYIYTYIYVYIDIHIYAHRYTYTSPENMD
jgi:hypothetical protein